MKRFGQVTRLKKNAYQEYKRLHAAVWPQILQLLEECNIRNYSIYHHDQWLFAYFEYHGDDFEADMKKIAEDPENKKWWAACTPGIDPIDPTADNPWWLDMEELFHMD
jgi:L-rhamnose mutarotase